MVFHFLLFLAFKNGFSDYKCHWWECKFIQPLWRAIIALSIKIYECIYPSDSTIAFWGIIL